MLPVRNTFSRAVLAITLAAVMCLCAMVLLAPAWSAEREHRLQAHLAAFRFGRDDGTLGLAGDTGTTIRATTMAASTSAASSSAAVVDAGTTSATASLLADSPYFSISTKEGRTH